MSNEDIGLKYEQAVQSFVEKVKQDQNVLAVILCGSLAYDTVWEKSDIDMLILIREQTIKTSSYSLVEDGIVINAEIQTKNSFQRLFERSTGGSIYHSIYSKGKIIYTTDESLYEYYDEIKKFGSSDIELAIFYSSCTVIGYMEKIEKWVRVKNDLMYAKYYVIKAAEAIAHMEICRLGNGEVPTREVLINATRLSPDVMQTFYKDPINKDLTREEILDLVDKIDKYLESHLHLIIKPVIEYMKDGEIKTVTMLRHRFHANEHFISHLFEYLSIKGIVEKISQTIRITPKGKMLVEELAFIFVQSEEGNLTYGC